MAYKYDDEDVFDKWCRIGNGTGRNAREHARFDLIQNKRSRYPDAHATLLLSEILPAPGSLPMIFRAEDGEISFRVHIDGIKTLSDEHILELIRCGVRYRDGYLRMYV